VAADLKLFAVLVGGRHARANIELHDVQFVAAGSIEEAVRVLQDRWWGTPSSLHIDAYAELNVIDGHRVELSDEANGQRVSLYFVNTGGYRDGVFCEDHAYSFHVGADRHAVWAAAKARAEFSQKHQDNFDIIDDIVCIDEALAQQNLRVRLVPTTSTDDVRIVAHYIKLPL
jgi:FAD/FMN-containing dehydrogenase